jgi:hypothetical protein
MILKYETYLFIVIKRLIEEYLGAKGIITLKFKDGVYNGSLPRVTLPILSIVQAVHL